MAYQWYPGHMTKTMRNMQEDIKLIDLIIELSDARIPISARNPELKTLMNGKCHLLLLNKADLADPAKTRLWQEYYKEQGITCAFIDSRNNRQVKNLEKMMTEACRERIERNKRRGILNKPMRAMIVGIPNVGKSTFINSFAGRAIAKTGNKPGVTKGKQWIRLNKSFELLDTPGVLWPKIEDDRIGENLAVTGSIRDEIMEKQELACILIDKLVRLYPDCFEARYGISNEGKAYEILDRIAVKRGCLRAGNEPDPDKAALMLLHDFRSGILGGMTLEIPQEDRT